MDTDKHIILPDGRKLAFAEFGTPDGYPVLYFHGSPMSRLEPLLIGDDVFCHLGLRVIAPDRPGMGGSDFQPNRGFSDWPKDVISLADALGLAQFAVLGNSGGAGYVAACASKIPDRLSAAVIVSGAWRMDCPEAKNNMPFPHRLFWILASRAPLLLRLLLKMMGSLSPKPREKELALLKKRIPSVDYALFAEKPDRIEVLRQTMRESMRQGTKGPLWDLRLYVREFDFQFDEIRMPLKLFHGELDINVPIALVRKVAACLPGAQLVIYENEAHLSTLCNHMDEFADLLVH
jgi:pimeloyl-ACP methyl ester carboxylesterase